MNAGELIKKKLTKVTLGASAATTVLEEYADSTQGKKRRRAGNERLLKDKAYLKTISKYVLSCYFVHNISMLICFFFFLKILEHSLKEQTLLMILFTKM